MTAGSQNFLVSIRLSRCIPWQAGQKRLEMLLGARQVSLSSRPSLFQFQGAPRQSPTAMLS